MRRFGLVLVLVTVAACGGDSGPAAPTEAPATQVNIHAPQLPNSVWTLDTIDGQPLVNEKPAKISFGLPESLTGLQLSGMCNRVAGKYHLDGQKITSSLEADTTNTCDAAAQTALQTFLDAVVGATAWAIDDTNTMLTLTGAHTLVLHK